MPVIFKGKTKQISYDGGKFWSHARLNSTQEFPSTNGVEIPHTPPILENLEDVDGKKYSFAIVQEFGNASLYRRHFTTGQNLYIYEKCNDFTVNPIWVPVGQGDSQEQNARTLQAAAGYFWKPEHDEPYISTGTPISTQSPVSNNQKTQIHLQFLLGDNGITGYTLDTIKRNCQSRAEYDACLKHLIEGGPIPANITQVLSEELASFKLLLTPANLQRLALNTGNYYDGHIATAGEVYTYARDFFISQLKRSQPDYVAPSLNLAGDPNWNLLCSPGSNLPAGTTLPTQTTAKQMLDSILAVYTPDGTANLTIKPQVTREQLLAANQSIEQIRTEGTQGTTLGNCLYLFVSQIAKNATYDNREIPFLNDLQQKITTALPNVQIDEPQPAQFIPLRVDQFAGGPGGATHADFVEFQKQNPNAILLIPDNFADATLRDNQRHRRNPHNLGLAIPMKPQIVDNRNSANPVYDLCTFGIPTAHPPAGMGLEAQKAKVKEYFARLYGELRRGRKIAVPQLDDNGNVRWAFGGGVVNTDSPLSQFVRDELTKLQNFCNGSSAIDEVADAAYKAAWDHSSTAPLPLPKPELAPLPLAPDSQVPGMQADKTLTSAGFRHKFSEWLARSHCQLIQEEDKTDKTRLLRGTLPSGVGVVIRKDQMRLDTNGGKPLTDDEFRQAMGELIDMYKNAYLPGPISPARPLGTDAQKAIIEELLVQRGVPMVPKLAETPTADSSADQSASPSRTL